MNLLALETSTHCLSVALYRDGEVIERAEEIANGGSERLLPWVNELLGEGGWRSPILTPLLSVPGRAVLPACGWLAAWRRDWRSVSTCRGRRRGQNDVANLFL
jgi:hypothetical protein